MLKLEDCIWEIDNIVRAARSHIPRLLNHMQQWHIYERLAVCYHTSKSQLLSFNIASPPAQSPSHHKFSHDPFACWAQCLQLTTCRECWYVLLGQLISTLSTKWHPLPARTRSHGTNCLKLEHFEVIKVHYRSYFRCCLWKRNLHVFAMCMRIAHGLARFWGND